MIASSGLAKTAAFSLAVAVHGAVVAVVFTGDGIEIAGDAGGVEASIGSSFADMAAGVMTPDAAQEVTKETSPKEVTAQDAPEDKAADVPPEETARDVPENAAKPQVAEANAVEPPKETGEPVETRPVAQAELAPRAPVTALEATPQETAQAVQPQTQDETLAPVDEAPTAVTRSLRPKTRSADFEKQHEPEPPKVAKAAPKKKAQRTTQAKPKPQPKGNAQQNAQTGATTGSQRAKASTSQGTGKTQATGNAAASNYPGEVMRKISRVPRPRVGSRGTAVVAFRIAANGGLAGISIARSSGSSKLDQAALRIIRRAAPFPPPPRGARRSFSIDIKGG